MSKPKRKASEEYSRKYVFRADAKKLYVGRTRLTEAKKRIVQGVAFKPPKPPEPKTHSRRKK